MKISTAAPEEWSAALDLALQHLSEEVRPARLLNILTLLAAGDINPEGIFVARDSVGLRGAICVPLPGASGLMWLPQTRPADCHLEDQLVQVALDWLHARGVKIAQAFLNPLDVPASGALLRCGFQPVTQLLYYEHALESVPPPTPLRLQYVTYEARNRDVFHSTLLRTYDGTLDCPELNGKRTIDEVIAGHLAQGKFRPEWWWLAYERDQPVGVGMVSEVPDSDTWDLLYLGVVPEARRRGVGRELTGHVLRAAQSARAPRLVLAVDGRNLPALQLYADLGFLFVDFREVYLYFWDDSLDARPT